MHYRKLGDTGLTVSEVGLGCNRIGGESQDTGFWIDLVRRAVELGVTIFDTSEVYADSESEKILGQAIGNADRVCIATKVSGGRARALAPYSKEHILRDCEESLTRLGRDCIEVYQLHSPTREELERMEWVEAFERLIEQGKIRIPAVAIRGVDDGLFLIKHGFARVLQITYSILETKVETELLPRARRAGVGLLCRMPLARGILTGKFGTFDSITDDHRAHMFGEKARDMIDKADNLTTLGSEYEGGLTRMALHFSLSPPAISSIIPGARTIEQLSANVTASDGSGLPMGYRTRIDQVLA